MKKHLIATHILTATAFSLFLTACGDVDDIGPPADPNLGAIEAPSDSLTRQDSAGSEPTDSYGGDAGGTEQ